MRGLLLLPLLLAAIGSVQAESKGHYSVTYQYIKVDGFESGIGELDIGTTDTHSLNFEIDYALTDRWTVSAGIPLVRKRYRGGGPHRPETIDPPRNSEFVDDGDYHNDWQDFHLGLSYLAAADPIVVEPFVRLSVPSNDYAFFGHAAVGQNLWHVELGTNLTYVPKLDDYFVQVSPSYTVVEKTLGQSVNHWRLNVAVGYAFSNSLAARVLLMAKEGDGLDFPSDFPPPRNTEKWYQHDRMVRHNYVNAGLALDWRYAPGQSVNFSVLRMIHADMVHVIDFTFAVAFSRNF